MDDQRSRRDISTPDVGIFPGLLNDEEEMADRPVSRGREYESGYAKLSLQGGHKGETETNLIDCYNNLVNLLIQRE